LNNKKLIEVAIPLDAINAAAAREKSIRHGHPSTLHLWWARRPLAAARAVIFSQMVDDPSGYVDELLADPEQRAAAEGELEQRQRDYEKRQALASEDDIVEPEPTLDNVAAEIERDRLFKLIEDLVLWENTTNEAVLGPAREEIRRSWRRTCAANTDHPLAGEMFDPEKLPGFHDPFAGGGALPLEAQRLGLESHASDLNPVAVLINKAMIEIPPKFADRPPLHPREDDAKRDFTKRWQGAEGLAADVRYYGQWMRDEAEKRIGDLYPAVEITQEMVDERRDLESYLGRELTVIAWLWARTVNSPNPAFSNVAVPLVSTFMLSTKKGKEAYVEPVIEGNSYRFDVRLGRPADLKSTKLGTSAGKRAAFRCLMSDTPVPYDYIRTEGKAGRMASKLMAIVAQGDRGRVYLSPTDQHEIVSRKAVPNWVPEVSLPVNPRDFKTPNYGLTTFADLFTQRQLVALTAFSDLVGEARSEIRRDAIAAGLEDDDVALRDGGRGARAYSEAISVYLAFALDKVCDRGSSLGRWDPTPTQSGIINTFSRQALPMTWDFAESNPLGRASGNYRSAIDLVAKSILSASTLYQGYASQADAGSQSISAGKLISTDPPYYDNIGYADLSDYFYTWLRRSLQTLFPELFSTVTVPKAEELIATPYRHGTKDSAERFFLDGMTKVMDGLSKSSIPYFPVTIYYAFKQSETKDSSGTASTGWETFLQALINAGFGITGTWPMRTELRNRMIGSGTNALASSIILVCNKLDKRAPSATRRAFSNTLKEELPKALIHLQRGNIAPVDLAQAAIGPGMAVFTRYSRVLDAEGTPFTVREALALINEVLDETLAEQEGDFDADSRWALTWFDQIGFEEGEYGLAEQLSKAKNTSVGGLVEAGILASKGSRVRLLSPEELPPGWDPGSDSRVTVWEVVHHLIRVLESDGEAAAGDLALRIGAAAEAGRELCYRLYTLCERKKRAKEALSYNGLVQSWPEIMRLAEASATSHPEQQQEVLIKE